MVKLEIGILEKMAHAGGCTRSWAFDKASLRTGEIG